VNLVSQASKSFPISTGVHTFSRICGISDVRLRHARVHTQHASGSLVFLSQTMKRAGVVHPAVLPFENSFYPVGARRASIHPEPDEQALK